MASCQLLPLNSPSNPVNEPWPDEPLDREDVFVFPTTVGQRGFWYLDQLRPREALYNIPIRYRLRGSLQIVVLERALNELIARHEALRTSFVADNEGVPVQVVVRTLNVRLRFSDLSNLPIDLRDAACEVSVAEEGRKPFDLTKGPLIRARLFRLREDDHVLVLTYHHIIVDGWSLGLITDELAALYGAFAQGQKSPLDELPIQYGDYAVWQAEWLKGSKLAPQLEFWKDQLRDLPDFELPGDVPSRVNGNSQGAIEGRFLPPNLKDKVTEICRQEKVTPFMVTLAAFQTLLSRYTGKDDVVVGSVHAGRNQPETEPLVGLFINPMVLRTNLSGDPTFREVLTRVRDTVLEAFANREVPFGQVVDAVQPVRDPSRHPLFQINFLHQRAFLWPRTAAGVTITPNPSLSTGSMFHLNFFLNDRAEGLRVACDYRTDRYSAIRVQRMLEHFEILLSSALQNCEQRLSELPLLTESEHRELLEWNQTQAPIPQTCLHELFEERAIRTPTAVAAVCNGRSLTYDELNRRANQVAQRLKAAGVIPDCPVGILLERSLDMFVSVLGILKAGGACLPLDLTLPRARLSYMIENARMGVLLTQKRHLDRLPIDGFRVVCLDEMATAKDQQEILKAPNHLSLPQQNLAYILYTSGSTGRPKGVAMNHRPIINLVEWEIRRKFAQSPVKTLQYAPLGFDVAFQEMFSTWATGGALVLATEELRHDLYGLWQMIDRERIERLYLPVVVLQQLAETAQHFRIWPQSLREIITAGEALRITPSIRNLFRHLPNCRLTNQYGPTEAHVVTCFELPDDLEDWPDLPPIGRPIANAEIYLLDRFGQRVPMGVDGELYIGGECLSRGYINQPELTAQRFVSEPKICATGERLYKTGDRARLRTDGEIEFLGRLDDQVKLRGYRIEIGEIESIISHQPMVANCVVVLREQNGEPLLVAYVTAHAGQRLDTTVLRAELKANLPSYMLPAKIVVLQSLPLSPNGKVDRSALPDFDASETAESRLISPPRDETEKALADLWQEALGTPVLSITEDFFDVGGNSLLAMSFLARIHRTFDRKINLATFLQSPTIEAIASFLRDDCWEEPVQRVFPLREKGNRPPLLLIDAGPFFRPLVRALGPDQPVFGVALPYLSELPKDFTTSDIAENLVASLLESPIVEPYYLAGWSAAGVLAFEMAQQLAVRGKRVARVLLFDTTNPAYQKNFLTWKNYYKHLYFKFEKILYHSRKMSGMSPRQAWQYLRERVTKYNVNSLRQFKKRMESSSDLSKSMDSELWKVQYLAALEYCPKPCQFPVALVRSTARQKGLFRDPNMGWANVSQAEFQSFEISGEHDDMFLAPRVDQLAEIIRSLLSDRKLTEFDTKNAKGLTIGDSR